MAILAVICIVVGFVIWIGAVARWTQGNVEPLILFVAIVWNTLTPPGLFGALLMLLGVVFVALS